MLLSTFVCHKAIIIINTPRKQYPPETNLTITRKLILNLVINRVVILAARITMSMPYHIVTNINV